MQSNSTMKLEISGVGKCYNNDFWGVKDFHMTFENGVTGLLGENGAGKSTLMRILATITKPTTGSLTWNGNNILTNPDLLKNELGYLPQDFGVYPNLNALEFLQYIGALKGIQGDCCKKRALELLELVNLEDVIKKPLYSYSGGMKQRIGIAQALLNDPKLLIVDEPTVGLDPTERVRFRNLLSDISSNRIVIFSTHIVSDVESTAGKIAIVSKGSLVHHSAPDLLLEKISGKVWELIVTNEEYQHLSTNHLITSTVRIREGIKIRVIHDQPIASNAKIVDGSLEDAYLYILSNKEAHSYDAIS